MLTDRARSGAVALHSLVASGGREGPDREGRVIKRAPEPLGVSFVGGSSRFESLRKDCSVQNWPQSFLNHHHRLALFAASDPPDSSVVGVAIGFLAGHSLDVFLNHAQMDPESLPIDFEWPGNPERPDGRFDCGDSRLIFRDSRVARALGQFGFELSRVSSRPDAGTTRKTTGR